MSRGKPPAPRAAVEADVVLDVSLPMDIVSEMARDAEEDTMDAFDACCMADISIGTVTLTYPVERVNLFSYYVMWAFAGWLFGAHRLYLGQLVESLVFLAGATVCIVFMTVWGVLYECRVTDFASLFLLLGGFLSGAAVVGVWLVDGCMGNSYVSSYKWKIEEAYIHGIQDTLIEETNADRRKLERDNRMVLVPYRIRKSDGTPLSTLTPTSANASRITPTRGAPRLRVPTRIHHISGRTQPRAGSAHFV